MNEMRALEFLEDLAAGADALPRVLEGHMLAAVMASAQRLEDGGELVDGEAAAVKAVLMALHAHLERTERDLLRHMKYESETARTWEDIAEEFGDLYGGRAAIFTRWKRLCSTTRRTTHMDMRRGAAIPRTPPADSVRDETAGPS